MKKIVAITLSSVLLAGCVLGSKVESNVIRTSSNMAIINVEVNKSCMGNNLIAASQKIAALTTLQAGYSSYIINKIVSPDYVIEDGYSKARIQNAKLASSNTPLPNVRSRSVKEDNPFKAGYTLFVQMYNPGDIDYRHAIDAKQSLGKDWQKILNNGKVTGCS